MPTPSPLPPITILGAGLTGLSAAHHLKEGYQLLERLGHVGGHVITLEEQGFRFDRTGHLLHLRDPDIKAWIEEMFPPNHLRHVVRKSLVYSHGRYTRYPYQANTFGLPPEVANECLLGYIKARFPDTPPLPASNFEEFCLQQFGEGFSRHFMIPYNCRLWGVHPREITAEWCSRFVPLPKLEDVIAGAVGLNDREMGYNTHFQYPPTGIHELPERLAEQVKPIRFHTSPTSIEWRNQLLRFDDGHTESYRALISTMPLSSLVALLEDVPTEVANAAKHLRCTKLWYLDIASTTPAGRDLHWVYVPEEKYPFYRLGVYSNFSERMAPAGGSSFYVELASREEPDVDILGPVVISHLVEMGLIRRAEDVAFVRARLIEHAYVIFDHSYYTSLKVIRPFLAEHNIISQGRYGAWNYSSMEDALIFGREAAKEAERILTSATTHL